METSKQDSSSCDDPFYSIELPERIYKRIERLMKIIDAIKKCFKAKDEPRQPINKAGLFDKFPSDRYHYSLKGSNK
jgi:hypothetical protein